MTSNEQTISAEIPRLDLIIRALFRQERNTNDAQRNLERLDLQKRLSDGYHRQFRVKVNQ